MNNMDLFEQPGEQQLIVQDGELCSYPQWLDAHQANAMFGELQSTLNWQQEVLTMYGREVTVPRLVAWYGDKDATYTYSGKMHQPLPWAQPLLQLRELLQTSLQQSFNSVLCNLYRHGKDSMGWHSDDEPELGDAPVIASLSLGQSRFFDVRNKRTGEKHRIPLHSGQLIVMKGSFQQHWQHQVPKQLKIDQPRINLTFRHIIA
ncbi:alpha-ketoglutarate-dependent dioxygenase AlkB [Pleionea sp. CnH1-48]|uniref:alpha-ketoglutarate-dependent dioxygenase AlkB family protein n=1 Tax=Pleionea sp. CnH1-48 TaxID=2954494 RepID=UPI0020974B3A|nr:alpha-ketoglutarate-dependent dioxygenase AlkB [Pleionea sp. CnH1-48]MCO7223915.1 alpha-ketoglutarate-dependent dioxygenase AlkB [Pleionea sp. CnH1-48]